ncbi:MAG: hypothetical protein LBI03_02480 [Clostridiales bacterium]|jgi:hypothetical protein|nr:hypothetical protein [Clostridiales bacterium]
MKTYKSNLVEIIVLFLLCSTVLGAAIYFVLDIYFKVSSIIPAIIITIAETAAMFYLFIIRGTISIQMDTEKIIFIRFGKPYQILFFSENKFSFDIIKHSTRRMRMGVSRFLLTEPRGPEGKLDYFKCYHFSKNTFTKFTNDLLAIQNEVVPHAQSNFIQ